MSPKRESATPAANASDVAAEYWIRQSPPFLKSLNQLKPMISGWSRRPWKNDLNHATRWVSVVPAPTSVSMTSFVGATAYV